jgi:hypothetical protein
MFDASEVPCEVRGVATRIDFVLHQNAWNGSGPIAYLVAECKRANPSHSHWCFATTAYLRRNLGRQLLADQVTRDGDAGVKADVHAFGHGRDVYSLAYEVRASAKGEGAPGRGAIEEACGQVLRGSNGLVELMREHQDLLTVNMPTLVVPAIFTTAKLWTSDVDLAAADLESGKLASDDVDLKPVPWLWYRYHLSPSLRHSEPAGKKERDLGLVVEKEFARCVAIVSTAGIDGFLTTEHW